MIYGDAIRETSTKGLGQIGWYSDYSVFAGLNFPFLVLGGGYAHNSMSRLFFFCRDFGHSYYSGGFRSVLVSL